MCTSKEWNILLEWSVPYLHWLTQKETLSLSVNQHGPCVLWLHTRGNRWQVPSFRLAFVLHKEVCFQWLLELTHTWKVFQQSLSVSTLMKYLQWHSIPHFQFLVLNFKACLSTLFLLKRMLRINISVSRIWIVHCFMLPNIPISFTL